MMQTKLTLINHASTIIGYGEFQLLSDPWFEGDAFHKGWDLIVPMGEATIKPMLETITHIYISHEHPDHFSIKFFLQYLQILKDRKVEIIFQQTTDQRVRKFLESKGLSVRELPINARVELANDVNVVCIKDGLIDSGLLIDTGGHKTLNINDCDITTRDRANEVHAITGDVDWLLTQFSYAAWKGGQANKPWRKLAAEEKLQSMQIQIDVFKPNYVLPFASFVYFSNARNFYLNDSVNTPQSVHEHFKKSDSMLILKPFDCFDGRVNVERRNTALHYWADQFTGLNKRDLRQYTSVELAALQEAFGKYVARVAQTNSWVFMWLARYLSPIAVMRPVIIDLEDTGKRVRFDLVGKSLEPTHEQADLQMSSESLMFMLKNSFGFDTLTVNGCFEELRPGAFVRATKTLGIENLNNVGIYFSPSILFNKIVYRLYMRLLGKVAKRLALNR
jgi:UDP-MurNAc hydroxylase